MTDAYLGVYSNCDDTWS